MRKLAGVCCAAAVALPSLFLAAPAEATSGTRCKSGMRGVETWSPPLPARSDRTAKPMITINGAKVTGCVGGGVKSGTLSAKIKWLDPGNCDSLLRYREGQPFPRIKGTVTIIWNTKQTSTANVTITRNKPYVQPVQGLVSRGKFTGSKLTVWLLIDPPSGACDTKPLTTVPFQSITKLVVAYPPSP